MSAFANARRVDTLDPMSEVSGARGDIRIDKWLWCVRAYKTRQKATEACKAGRISIGGHAVRPARAVRPGDLVEINLGGWKRTLRVVSDLGQRLKASALSAFVEDVTPADQKELARERRVQNLLGRPSGAGRPTKRDRREWKRAFLGEGS